MKPETIAALAAEFQMTERHASPFGSPHYVNDSKGAELELIVGRRDTLHVSLLFEAESMANFNFDHGDVIENWTEDKVRRVLQRLDHRRSSREMESIIELELEAA